MTEITMWTVYTAEATHGGYWAVWATPWTVTEGPQLDGRRKIHDVIASRGQAEKLAASAQAEYDRIRNIGLASLDV